MPNLTADWWLAFPPWHDVGEALRRFRARFGVDPQYTILRDNAL